MNSMKYFSKILFGELATPGHMIKMFYKLDNMIIYKMYKSISVELRTQRGVIPSTEPRKEVIQ